MIYVKRGREPKYLRSPKVKKAKDFLSKYFKDIFRQKRLPFDMTVLRPIKEDLGKIFKHKCAYCESVLGVTDFYDIDNFRPKGGAKGFDNNYAPDHYWWLAYEWENLFLSCQMCNQKYKRDWFPLEDESQRAEIGALGEDLLLEKPLLINPCLERPEEHLQFLPDGFVIPITNKGKVTVEILGLNREELVYNRRHVSKNLEVRLALLVFSYNQKVKADQEIFGFVSELFSDNPTQEYAATQREVFKQWQSQNHAVWEYLTNLGKEIANIEFVSFPKEQIKSQVDFIQNEKVEAQLSSIKRFSIKSIEIKNFKGISNLTLNLLPVNEKETRESWLLLLGDNGIGKSSILQALALTLAGKKQLLKLNLNPSEFLSRGEAAGYVKIRSYESDQPIELHINQSEFRSILDEPPTFILAYGSTRLLPKGNLQPDLGKEPYLNIRNLFDYSFSLRDVNKWLSLVSSEEFKKRIAPALFEILALVEEDRVLIKDGKLCIMQHNEESTLEEVSDGYKSIIALASDIMQTLSIDSAGYHSTQGIVLIDELGNHLHPRWRMRIVEALRKAFPKLQFIVTTHEPLCLRGVSHGEVNVLVRDENHEVRALDKDLLPDHTLLKIDQLLTSDLFGLINTLDPQTEKSFEEYYSLLGKTEEKRTKADKEKIKQYSTSLANKEIQGSTPQVQALFEVINEKFAQNIIKEGFRTKEELKKETIAQVKELIDTNKLDWL